MCQTTGRHKTCPPYHFPLAKSDYNPEEEEEEEKKKKDIVDSVHTKMNSASAITVVLGVCSVTTCGVTGVGISTRRVCDHVPV